MKKGLMLTLLIVAGFFVYFLLVSILSLFFSFSFTGFSSSDDSQVDNGDVVIGLSDTVSTSVKRDRWYGTIYETSGDTGSKVLYLFDIFKLRLRAGGSSLWLVHLFSLAVVVASIFLTMKLIHKHNIERGIYY